MRVLWKIITIFLILHFSQFSFAQNKIDDNLVQSGPAFEIYSGPSYEGPDPTSSISAIPLASNGSWSNSAAGPTIYSKNWWYYLKLNPTVTVPATATIQSVYYNWSLSRKPVGLLVYLCHSSTTTGPCVDVTNIQNGTVDFSGRLANQPLIYAFRVNGSGSLSPPVYGQMDQVIVNYQY